MTSIIEDAEASHHKTVFFTVCILCINDFGFIIFAIHKRVFVDGRMALDLCSLSCTFRQVLPVAFAFFYSKFFIWSHGCLPYAIGDLVPFPSTI